MHKLLDNYLCKIYPKIFIDRYKSPQESCMHWGFSCGNGWFYLINDLCYNIQQHIDSREEGITKKWDWAIKLGKVEQVICLQCKEKFSTLRFYTSGGDEYTSGMIDLAESLSGRICETCGKMDCQVSRNSKGWIHTTCLEHTENYDLEDFLKNASYNKELFDIWMRISQEENIKK